MATPEQNNPRIGKSGGNAFDAGLRDEMGTRGLTTEEALGEALNQDGVSPEEAVAFAQAAHRVRGDSARNS